MGLFSALVEHQLFAVLSADFFVGMSGDLSVEVSGDLSVDCQLIFLLICLFCLLMCPSSFPRTWLCLSLCLVGRLFALIAAISAASRRPPALLLFSSPVLLLPTKNTFANPTENFDQRKQICDYWHKTLTEPTLFPLDFE